MSVWNMWGQKPKHVGKQRGPPSALLALSLSLSLSLVSKLFLCVKYRSSVRRRKKRVGWVAVWRNAHAKKAKRLNVLLLCVPRGWQWNPFRITRGTYLLYHRVPFLIRQASQYLLSIWIACWDRCSLLTKTFLLAGPNKDKVAGRTR